MATWAGAGNRLGDLLQSFDEADREARFSRTQGVRASSHEIRLDGVSAATPDGMRLVQDLSRAVAFGCCAVVVVLAVCCRLFSVSLCLRVVVCVFHSSFSSPHLHVSWHAVHAQ